MDSLFLKIICAAFLFVFYVSCRSTDRDDDMNDAYHQKDETPVNLPDKTNETNESHHFGNRIGVGSRMDSSANSTSPFDSNPK